MWLHAPKLFTTLYIYSSNTAESYSFSEDLSHQKVAPSKHPTFLKSTAYFVGVPTRVLEFVAVLVIKPYFSFVTSLFDIKKTLSCVLSDSPFSSVDAIIFSLSSCLKASR